MEPIVVNTHFENPEFPTRVTILDFKGEYDDPDYTFSVQIQVEYNQVVDGEELNLLTFTFWTEEDTCWCHGEDEDGEPTMDEGDVEDWFEEGLHEDLSFHDLEGLEELDLYGAGVAYAITEDDEYEAETDVCSAIENAGIHIDEYDIEFSDAYYEDEEEDIEEEEVDYSEEIDYVVESIFKYQQRIIKEIEDAQNDPDDEEEYEYSVDGVMGKDFYAFGVTYIDGMYYICFGDIFGSSIEYEEYGESSESPFTKDEIREYVEDVYYEMLSE